MYNTVENTSKTIEDIIRCSGKRFRDVGYRKTTVDEIARDLHISKRTLYTFFSSKEDIVREVAWRDTLDAVRSFAATVPAGTPSERMILALCRDILTDRIRQGKDGRYAGIYRGDSDLRDAYRGSLRRVFSHLYEDGKRHGRLKPVDPDFAAEAILALLLTAADRFAIASQPLGMFNDTLGMIADAIAFRDRVPFEALG